VSDEAEAIHEFPHQGYDKNQKAGIEIAKNLYAKPGLDGQYPETKRYPFSSAMINQYWYRTFMLFTFRDIVFYGV
jgi:hypothetical protein